MITLTACNDVRCSVRREQIAAIEPGRSTTIILHTGIALAVRESPEEIQRLLAADSRATRAATAGPEKAHDDGH